MYLVVSICLRPHSWTFCPTTKSLWFWHGSHFLCFPEFLGLFRFSGVFQVVRGFRSFPRFFRFSTISRVFWGCLEFSKFGFSSVFWGFPGFPGFPGLFWFSRVFSVFHLSAPSQLNLLPYNFDFGMGVISCVFWSFSGCSGFPEISRLFGVSWVFQGCSGFPEFLGFFGVVWIFPSCSGFPVFSRVFRGCSDFSGFPKFIQFSRWFGFSGVSCVIQKVL